MPTRMSSFPQCTISKPKKQRAMEDNDSHRTPLLISPLFQYELENENKSPGHYKTIQRIVTVAPNDPLGEVETCIEEFISDGGDCLWKRVAVRGGPGRGDGPSRFIHATFSLPMTNEKPVVNDEGQLSNNDNMMCWAAFPDRPNHKLLCVLATPSLLCIWDVYPSQRNETELESEGEGGGEGHSVTLPFEARAVFALGEYGVLVQRIDTIDDHYLFESDSMWMRRTGAVLEDDPNDDGFILADPPKPVRLGGVLEASSSSPAGAGATYDAPLAQMATHAVPALFSLRHPLDEVIPVAMNEDGAGASLFADVYEQLLFVGTSRWTDHQTDDSHRPSEVHSQPICVSYHTRLKRHAVWQLKSAPPAPSAPPLWQISRNQRNPASNLGVVANENLGVVESAPAVVDEDDMWGSVTAIDTDASHYELSNIPHSDRNDALADALGVNRNKKGEDAVSSNLGRNKGRARRSGSLSGPPPFLSPPPAGDARKGLAEFDALNNTSAISPKVYGGTPRNPTTPLAFDTSFSSSPFTNLHPDISFSLLYEEKTSTSDSDLRASNVFLASNAHSSGTRLVCLLCPVENKDYPCELRCYSIEVEQNVHKTHTILNTEGETIESGGYAFSILPLSVIPCTSAQSVQAYPIAPCSQTRCSKQNRNDYQEPMATDILVLKSTDQGGETSNIASLGLYRAGLRVVDCVLMTTSLGEKFATKARQNTFANVLKIDNAVSDRIDFTCMNEAGKKVVVRGMLSCSLSSSPVAEKALAAIESALVAKCGFAPFGQSFVPTSIELALKIRADSVRLLQHLHASGDEKWCAMDDPAWSAVSTVLLSVIEFDLFGPDDTDRSSNRSGNVGEYDSEDEDWMALMTSEYNQNYSAEHGSSLFLGRADDEGNDSFSTINNTPSSQSAKEQLCTAFRSMFSLSAECLSREISSLTFSTRQKPSSDDSPRYARTLFDSLHLLYEDSKLRTTTRSGSQLRAIGSILVRACKLAENASTQVSPMAEFLDYYQRDLGCNWLNLEKKTVVRNVTRSSTPHATLELCRQDLTSFARPPSFFSWIDGLMSGCSLSKSNGNVYFEDGNGKFNSACRTTRSLHRVYSTLFRCGTSHADFIWDDQHLADVAVVNTMIQEGMDDPVELRNDLPIGLVLPLMETLYRCRVDHRTTSNSTWPSVAWSLIGRADLGQHFGKMPNPVDELRERGNERGDAAGLNRQMFIDRDQDGLVQLELSSSMLFPHDNRIREAGRLLRSSRPTFLRVSRSVETSDHDYERLKQEKLLVLCRRVLALPVGRGMLTLGTLRPVPAEPLPLPELCLSGRVPPTNATLKLDVSNSPSDLKVWPDFHNGVAAGLRLVTAERSNEDTIRQITRTWIVYNRPVADSNQSSPQNANSTSSETAPQADHVHGGLLMALGLRGHLSALSMTDIYDYLTQGTVTTTVGILLGMASNKVRTCDPSVSKLLCLHIPSLLPASFASIDVAGPAQTAAVAGIGLLYQKSSHRLMTEFLLNEMGKRPTNDTGTSDREAYTLSCGLALGMVNLCQGQLEKNGESGGSGGLADLHIEERLHRYVVGGVDDMELRRRREAVDRANNAQGIATGESERCSRIFEGDTINTDVTAPGATLALGLMFLQSGNKAIASSLALPDTHFLLEYVRPDFLLLRVVARSLILWNDVMPTSKWIEDQIPVVVKNSFGRMKASVQSTADLSDFANIETGAKKEPKESGDDEMHSADHRESSPGEKKSGDTPFPEQDGDRQAIRQIHAHVVAGACFAIGLRFAGTGDESAAEAIGERLMDFLTLRDENDPLSVALRPEHPILEMCLGCSAIALAMVMAGTGDLDTLRLFKMLRWRCDDDIRYGTHMAFSTAIGLLFLGGGTCTLGRSPEDIAALVLAFFPRFPSSTSDNRYHLQALRHCYALAVKRRELIAVDVDTGEQVSVPIEITFRESTTHPMKLEVPVLLRNTSDTLTKLNVVSERYYPLSLDLIKNNLFEAGLTLFVKKRSGFLGHFQDPQSQRSLLVQAGSSSGQSALELIQSFTEDPRILAYAQYLCDTGGSKFESHAQANGNGFAISEFCTNILHECLTGDKEDILPLYLSLRSAVDSIGADPYSTAVQTIWDVRLIRRYYEQHHLLVRGSERLVSPEFVAFLCELLDSFMIAKGVEDSSLESYFNSGIVESEQCSLGCFLVWYNVPFPNTSSDFEVMDHMEIAHDLYSP